MSARNPNSASRDLNLWSLKSPMSGTGTIDEQLEALLGVLVPAVQSGHLPGDCELEISLGVTADGMGRLHDISAASVRHAAALGASIRIDAYSNDQGTSGA